MRKFDEEKFTKLFEDNQDELAAELHFGDANVKWLRDFIDAACESYAEKRTGEAEIERVEKIKRAIETAKTLMQTGGHEYVMSQLNEALRLLAEGKP